MEKLHNGDFLGLRFQVDPIICEYGTLRGLLIDAEDFYGWESFITRVPYCVFTQEQHKHIQRIALISDRMLLNFMPQLVEHFLSAEVRPFPRSEYDSALDWLAKAG